MNSVALLQLAISGLAVALVVGLTAWMTRGRGAPRLDDAEARRWLADEFPGRVLDGLWLATDGRGALGKSGDTALVLSRIGDRYAARAVPWASALAGCVKGGRVRIRLSDPAAPQAVLALASWPPKGFET